MLLRSEHQNFRFVSQRSEIISIFLLGYSVFVKTFQAFERLGKRQMAEALEVWKFLDYLMHYNTNVEYSALMQRQTITKSLQLVLIVACLASTGQ